MIFENKINAPESTFDPKEVDYKKQGKETSCQIVLRIEDRWNAEKIKQTEEEQRKIYDIIDQLPKEFNISHLLNTFLSSKGAEVYVGKTTAEKKRVADFQARKTELENQLPRFPDFFSEKYSLFLEEDPCLEDEFQTIFPREAAEEIFGVHELIHQTLKAG